MLGVLTLLVTVVLLIPMHWIGPADKGDIFIWRKDVLAIIITAFGAWVGAGAAYFFGRENLRVAADSLLAMRGLSGKELLRRTSIKQIPPTTS
jgi:glycopeptide antibiotics resistance protein